MNDICKYKPKDKACNRTTGLIYYGIPLCLHCWLWLTSKFDDPEKLREHLYTKGLKCKSQSK